jgi:hypothetical protein
MVSVQFKKDGLTKTVQQVIILRYVATASGMPGLTRVLCAPRTCFDNVSQSGVALRLPPHSIDPRRSNTCGTFGLRRPSAALTGKCAG